MSRKKPIGYLVMDSCEDYEQALRLCTGMDLPNGGVLGWPEARGPRSIFKSRADAVAAISRTEHYRLAFGRINMPEKKYCKIVPVEILEGPAP